MSARTRWWSAAAAVAAVAVLAAATVVVLRAGPAEDEHAADRDPAGDAAPAVGDVVLGVHGGAGAIRRDHLTEARERRIRAALTDALLAGYEILSDGGSSVDAVEAAVVVLEDSPHFNAGRGAVSTAEGTHELDASIMRGADRDAGAVTVVRRVANPVALARLVLDRSAHVLLAGDGAERFAAEHGVDLVDPVYFSTPQRGGAAGGTVGAVALDRSGDLAAATSTGGLADKAAGRVGDSPIVGAATYADSATVAVSTTGVGEVFLRLGVARDIAALMEYRRLPVHDAARAALDKVVQLGGEGGLIALDPAGDFTMPFTTAGMHRGYVTRDGDTTVHLFGDE